MGSTPSSPNGGSRKPIGARSCWWPSWVLTRRCSARPLPPARLLGRLGGSLAYPDAPGGGHPRRDRCNAAGLGGVGRPCEADLIGPETLPRRPDQARSSHKLLRRGRLMANVRYAVEHLDSSIRSLEGLSGTDHLTGLPNRREGEGRLANDIARTRRGGA